MLLLSEKFIIFEFIFNLTLSHGLNSIGIPILTSISSLVALGSRTLNHGGELKEQQVLEGPHPCLDHLDWMSVYHRSNSFQQMLEQNWCCSARDDWNFGDTHNSSKLYIYL